MTSVWAGIAAAVWALFEVSLLVRDWVRSKGRTDHDAGTRAIIRVVIYATFIFGIVAAYRFPALAMALGWAITVGVTLMWLGLIIRVWAVVSLGRAFRTTVEVDAEQMIVTTGPYRWVRHPAYTGLLILLAGFGLSLANWLSLAVFVALPTIAVLRRIKVEEAELTRVLGDRYTTYRIGTKRLIPGLW